MNAVAPKQQKFATATAVDVEFKEKERPALTPDDVQFLRLTAQSFMSDDWRADSSGKVVNAANYVVAECAHQTDAVAFARFSPWRLHQLLDMAEQVLDMEPTAR